MLIVMTFNIGFLIAAVGGYMLGTVLLSHLVVPQHGRRQNTAKRGQAAGDSSSGSWLKGAATKLRGGRGGAHAAMTKDVEQGHMAVESSDPGSASGSGSELEEEGSCPACAACAGDTAHGRAQDQQAMWAGPNAAAAAARSSAYQQAAVHHAGDGCC